MNTLLLVIGFRPWADQSARAILTAIFAAITIVSLEMQVATLSGVSGAGLNVLRLLPWLNAAIAICGLLFWRPRIFDAGARVSPFSAVPWPAWVAVLLVVLALQVARPLGPADPYHIEKADWIAASGTLAHNPAAQPKVNGVNPLYELVLADLRQVPLIGDWLLRLHGLLGLLLMLVAIAAARELLDAPPGRRSLGEGPLARRSLGEGGWSILLAVPVLFHQLVLIKNDLFVAAPGLVVLVWAVARARSAPLPEIAWAAWLAAIAVAVKPTSLALLVVAGGAILLERRGDWKALAMVAAGAVAGVVSAGLVLGLVQNIQSYGVPMPVDERNHTFTAASVLVSIARFGVSLFDFGLLTRQWWPGRGGWGGTFGLPLLWAFAAVLSRTGTSREARRALLYGAFCLLAFAAVFREADIAHRLALAPALLIIAAAAFLATDERGLPKAVRLALVPVLILSGAQIARSAFLYLIRGTV
jgi:hypothetical protein